MLIETGKPTVGGTFPRLDPELCKRGRQVGSMEAFVPLCP